jgi:hypothetical protein
LGEIALLRILILNENDGLFKRYVFRMGYRWFSLDIENNIAFFASGGGFVPHSIESESIVWLSDYFKSLPEIKDNELFVNPRLSDIFKLDTDWQMDSYLRDFIFMAKRGIYAYDKTKVGEMLDPFYHLVVTPSIKLSVHDLPENVFNEVQKTRYSTAFKDITVLDVNTFNDEYKI